jgi:hypothetical protein
MMSWLFAVYCFRRHIVLIGWPGFLSTAFLFALVVTTIKL